jgi:hypothetical protein
MLIDPKDPRIQTTWNNSKECFAKALKLLHYEVEQIDIPYEGTTLPGYYYHYEDKDKDKETKNNNTLIHL